MALRSEAAKDKGTKKALKPAVREFIGLLPISESPGPELADLTPADIAFVRAALTALAQGRREGANIKRVTFEQLDDIDAGEPPRLLVVAHVHAGAAEGNQLWDRALARVEAQAAQAADALSTRVSLVFRWQGI